MEQATRAADESAYAANEYAYGTFYWGPTIDGQVIRDHPYNEFRSGHFTKVPLMIDRDGDEGLAFTNTSIATDQDVLQDFANLWHDGTGFYAKIVMELYPESIYNASHIDDLTYFNILKQEGMSANFSDAFVRRSSAFGDAIVNCPSSYIASHFADAGLPVYKLIFNAGSQLHAATGAYLFSSYINGKFNPRLAEILRFCLTRVSSSRWLPSGRRDRNSGQCNDCDINARLLHLIHLESDNR